jgi:uncharacterized protein
MFTVSISAELESARSLKGLLVRSTLLGYFILAFAGAWISWLPLVLSKNGLGLLPFIPTIGWIYALEVLGSLAGPTLAAFLVTAAIAGKQGVQILLRRYVQRRGHTRWFLLILLGAPILLILAAAIAGRFGGIHNSSLLAQRWPQLVTLYLPIVALSIVGGPLGEEPGWRGLALPRLQQRYGALSATLILGVLWGLWHLPLFLVKGIDGPFTLPGFGLFLLGVITFTIFLTWVFNNTGGSLLIAIVLHATFNANSSLVVLLSPTFPLLSWNLYLVYGGCALLVLLLTKGHLSYKPATNLSVHADQTGEIP